MKHYLVTIVLNDMHSHMHGYVMTSDRKVLEAAMVEMMDIAEEQEPLRVPVVLQTELSTGSEIVREILCRLSNEAKECMRTATDFHRSVFVMTDDHPDDMRLMELH